MLEVTLRRYALDVSDLSGITIKFALAAAPRGNVDADERQDTVTRTTPGVNQPSFTPVAVGLLNSTMDHGTNIRDYIGRFFVEDGALQQDCDQYRTGTSYSASQLSRNLNVTQLHPYSSLAWSVISVANQVSLFLNICTVTCC